MHLVSNFSPAYPKTSIPCSLTTMRGPRARFDYLAHACSYAKTGANVHIINGQNAFQSANYS
ncbi:hypothetical protein T440DRAFT_272616 [Plenodomus tracheiphilus IPT5]|uniref:Uncharacterized protein n=1 Tax=Plenodomus tracheiphilus IPT5 TaxID=1408161 RepID=A0A6A7BIT2_9PLEO|nr:hypothetical protein T440DRAFT_272616 [Plenodomus tracheiphilus IPT5]